MSMSEKQKGLKPQIDAARVALLKSMAAVERAKATRGQPGGLTNLAAAEIQSGVFVAEHGKALLDYILLKEGINPAQGQEVGHAA